MNDRAGIMRRDLDRGMHPRSGRPADQQRNLAHAEPLIALHLSGDIGHLFQRRRDQTRQADHVGAFDLGTREDLVARDHHAHVDHIEVVALEHDRDDVLADVVDVALDGRDHDFPAGPKIAGSRFFGLDIGHQMGDRLLHHTGRLDHLRQEHLAGTEEIAHDIHAVHQRAFDHLDRTPAAGFDLEARRLGVLDHELGDAVDERMGQALGDRLRTPGEVFFAACRATGEGGRKLDHAFGRGLAVIG